MKSYDFTAWTQVVQALFDSGYFPDCLPDLIHIGKRLGLSEKELKFATDLTKKEENEDD